MFLKRRASKLMGLEATKHLLTVDLEELSVSMGNIPASAGFVEGSWFLVSLEKRSRSATSSRKEIKLDHSGINPMAQSKLNAQVPVIIPIRDRLQMVVTLYKESKKSAAFQQKFVTIKLKTVKADSSMGIDVLVPIASQSLNISEYASASNLEGREVTLTFKNLPQSTLRAQVSLTPIEEGTLGASSNDVDDNVSVSSREGSDVGFDYEDLMEPATKVLETAGVERRKSIARRSSYLAEDAAAPPTLQRKRSLVVQRAKSHLSSLFAQIKEDDQAEMDEQDLLSSKQDMVDEVTRLSLSLSSPGMLTNSPLFSQRSRLGSQATPSMPSASRTRRVNSAEAGQPSPFMLTEHGQYMKELLGNRSWVSVMFRLARQQVSEQRALVANLTEELSSLRTSHATQLEELQREVQSSQAELSVVRDRLAVMEERERVARLQAIAPPQPPPPSPPPAEPLVLETVHKPSPTLQDSSVQTLDEERPEDEKEIPVAVEIAARSDQAVQTEDVQDAGITGGSSAASAQVSSQEESKHEPSPRSSIDQTTQRLASTGLLATPSRASSSLQLNTRLSAAALAMAGETCGQEGEDEAVGGEGEASGARSEDEVDVDADPATYRQSFLVSPKNRDSLAIQNDARVSMLDYSRLLEELARAREQVAELEQQQDESSLALRDAANKIVEACIKRAELEWELEESLADLEVAQEENAVLLEELARLRKKHVAAAQQADQIREQYTKLEVKYRMSMAPTSPAHAVRKQSVPS